MFKFKQKPEDFKVTEKIKLDMFDDPEKKGDYSYYTLTKKDQNTIDAVMIIAKAWHIKPKFINFAGTKDKNAVTEQVISISKGPKKDLYLDNITLNYLGQGNERINLGSLEGNGFEIIVETDNDLNNGQILNGLQVKKLTKTINYFDDQRFDYILFAP